MIRWIVNSVAPHLVPVLKVFPLPKQWDTSSWITLQRIKTHQYTANLANELLGPVAAGGRFTLVNF